MKFLKVDLNSTSNFDLKHVYTDLKARSSSTLMDIAGFEAARLRGASLTASKHGLEAICGASCETGAQ